MADNTDEVVLRLGEVVQQHEKQIGELLEMIQSLMRNLTNAFREQGYDFQKLTALESSRRRLTIQSSTDVFMTPEEIDPRVQDEIAQRILTNQPLTSNKDLIEIQRAQINQAANKGRKE